MADEPQRRVLNIVDAIVAGHGDGPLAPQPAPIGMLLAGSNSAAVDRIGAQLLGYDPEMIPIVRRAFEDFRWSLVRPGASDVDVVGDLGAVTRLLPDKSSPTPLIHPVGWVDAVLPGYARHAAAEMVGFPVDA
jgi:uncharacterized protein (DUF362 family)